MSMDFVFINTNIEANCNEDSAGLLQYSDLLF
jgi:hypothetical protein